MSENALKGAKHAGQTARFIPISQNIATFALTNARMAESVDALVSNTSGATHLGSSPSPGTDND